MHAHHDSPSVSTPPQRPALVYSSPQRGGPAGLLVAEWHRLSRSRAVLREVNSWEFLGAPVAHIDEVLERCGFGRRTDDSAADHMLWQLVRLAAHDDLAARIALHRVLPAVMSIARRRGRIHPRGAHAAMGELLTTAWEIIRTYPCERRPRKVAANIVRDIEYFTYVRDARLKRVEEVSVEGDHGFGHCEPDDLSPADELDEVLADAAQAGLDPASLSLLRRYAAGESTDTIATSLGLSPRTVRNRRRAAIDEVRQCIADTD